MDTMGKQVFLFPYNTEQRAPSNCFQNYFSHHRKYVAINRGAIHVSPLVGHIQSVKSINYQPAPGSTW